MPKKYKLRNYNFKLLVFLLVLSVIGVLAVGSAKPSLQSRQIVGLCLGLFLMFSLTFIDYNLILKFYWPLYIANIVLLLLVQFMGVSSNNAQRWVNILGIQFQPSETAKILLILFYAQFIMRHEEKLNSFGVLLKCVALLAPPLLLVLNQPDLSTSIVIVVTFCVLIFVGGLSFKIIAALFAVLIPSVVIFLFVALQPGQETFLKEYQQERILAWIQPEKYALTTAYQQQNSITAIGSGQLMGKGLNNDGIDSVKSGNYISEPQTDFIFAIIGEELGFIGGAVVIVLSMLIALECFNVARKAPDLAGELICSGVGAIICIQSFINISVATGIIPNTGIPLPFVSYGLTSLVSLFIGMGFVMNISLQRFETRKRIDNDFE